MRQQQQCFWFEVKYAQNYIYACKDAYQETRP